MNTRFAVELGERLFEQAKEHRSLAMVDWTRRAVNRQEPQRPVKRLTGVDETEQVQHYIIDTLPYDPISEDDILVDFDPDYI